MSPECGCGKKYQFIQDGEGYPPVGRDPGMECGNVTITEVWRKTFPYGVETVRRVCRRKVRLAPREELAWGKLVKKRKQKERKREQKEAKRQRDRNKTRRRSEKNTKGQKKKKKVRR